MLEDVWKIYRMGEVEVTALRGVTLKIQRGQFVVILGPSGSGKTTLLNLVGGLDKPTRGEITVHGQKIHQLKEKELTLYRRYQVGFIFQFFNLISTLSALENVEYGLELVGIPINNGKKRSFSPKLIRQKALDALRSVGLEDKADHFPSQLSGGEQQRVAIARAIAKDPAILLCDEPTGSLDYETGVKVLSTLKAIASRDTKTILLVTHNSDIAKIADRVIRLRSGHVIEDQLNEKPLAPEQLVW